MKARVELKTKVHKYYMIVMFFKENDVLNYISIIKAIHLRKTRFILSFNLIPNRYVYILG
jgi:hypothetical protein